MYRDRRPGEGDLEEEGLEGDEEGAAEARRRRRREEGARKGVVAAVAAVGEGRALLPCFGLRCLSTAGRRSGRGGHFPSPLAPSRKCCCCVCRCRLRCAGGEGEEGYEEEDDEEDDEEKHRRREERKQQALLRRAMRVLDAETLQGQYLLPQVRLLGWLLFACGGMGEGGLRRSGSKRSFRRLRPCSLGPCATRAEHKLVSPARTKLQCLHAPFSPLTPLAWHSHMLMLPLPPSPASLLCRTRPSAPPTCPSASSSTASSSTTRRCATAWLRADQGLAPLPPAPPQQPLRSSRSGRRRNAGGVARAHKALRP